MRYEPQIAEGGTTHYIRTYGLRGERDAHDTAVFIPDRFHTSPRVDLILYFHGNTSLPDVRAYVDRRQMREVRRAVAADGRFALAVPFLGGKPDQGGGNYIVGNGAALDTYLDQVIRFVADNGPGSTICPVRLNLNALVLAGHSGGGKALGQAAMAGASSHLSRLLQVWAFDTFYYGDGAAWAAWALGHPAVQLHAFWTTGRTAVQGAVIAAVGAGNVSASAVTVAHDEIPNTMFPALLPGLTPSKP
jgi:hypothetical protein